MNIEAKEVNVVKLVEVIEKQNQFTLILSEEEAKILKGLAGKVAYTNRKSGQFIEKLYTELGKFIPYKSEDYDRYFSGTLDCKDFE